MRSGNEKWELEVGMRSGERMRMDVGRESRQKDRTRKADKQEIWQAQLQARGVDKDIGEGERDGEWGRGAGSGSGGMRINPIFNSLKYISHDVNRRYYAIWSIYISVEISRNLLISVIDIRVENLKYQMHDIYFQNIQGFCFFLVPLMPLHLDSAESNSSLNFDTFRCHIFTFFNFSHILN